MGWCHVKVLVIGGGPSGCMAAIAAAEQGASVQLVERHGFLGGMTTAALVGPVMTFHAGKTQIVKGIAGRIFDTLKTRGGTPGHLVDPIWGNTSMTPVDTEVYKPLLIEEVKKAQVEIRLHSMVVGVDRKGSQIVSVDVAGKSGVEKVFADAFIDASGDGDLAARAGCQFIMGRVQDGLTQPMTLMFKMGGVEPGRVLDAVRADPSNFYLGVPLEQFLDTPRLAIAGFFKEVAAAKAKGRFPIDRDRLLFFGLPRESEVSVNTLRVSRVLGTDPRDLSRAEVELRSQVPWLVSFFKENIPGFANSYLLETAAQIGVRETRHIVGDYTLTAQDVFSQRKFEDTIAHASYPMDIHSPDGSGMKLIDPRKNNPESFYQIPYRCMVPQGVENLLVTGRCISAEHEASASARISATCMALGEAAGRAAGLLKSGQSFRQVDVRELQKALTASGAFLSL